MEKFLEKMFAKPIWMHLIGAWIICNLGMALMKFLVISNELNDYQKNMYIWSSAVLSLIFSLSWSLVVSTSKDADKLRKELSIFKEKIEKATTKNELLKLQSELYILNKDKVQTEGISQTVRELYVIAETRLKYEFKADV